MKSKRVRIRIEPITLLAIRNSNTHTHTEGHGTMRLARANIVVPLTVINTHTHTQQCRSDTTRAMMVAVLHVFCVVCCVYVALSLNATANVTVVYVRVPSPVRIGRRSVAAGCTKTYRAHNSIQDGKQSSVQCACTDAEQLTYECMLPRSSSVSSSTCVICWHCARSRASCATRAKKKNIKRCACACVCGLPLDPDQLGIYYAGTNGFARET